MPDVDEAKLTWLRFYGQLEALLRRHQPIDYGVAVAKRMRLCARMPKLFAQTPPHSLLHSVEANCAYARGQNTDVVTERSLLRVMALYNQHIDPLIDYYLRREKNIELFAGVMYRQQIPLQFQPDLYTLARAWFLFASGNPLPRTAASFERAYGLPVAEWFKLAFLTYTCADKHAAFLPSYILNAECVEVPEDFLRAYLSLCSFTPREIRERYRSDRRDTGYRFHGCISSVFLTRPLIDFGHDRYLAPRPELVMRHASEGLYQLSKHCEPQFHEELGNRFEKYSELLLRGVAPARRLVSEAEMRKHASGKNCDFLLEFEDSLVLLECKAVIRSARILTEEVLRQDNSTKKIQRAILQLCKTSCTVKDGVLDALDVDSSKPLFGFVVVFGDIPFANSRWYFERVISFGLEEKLARARTSMDALAQPPVVLTSEALELFVTAVNTGMSVVELSEEKARLSYNSVGDWPEYLQSKLTEQPPTHLPKFISEVSDEYFASLGVGSDAEEAGAS